MLKRYLKKKLVDFSEFVLLIFFLLIFDIFNLNNIIFYLFSGLAMNQNVQEIGKFSFSYLSKYATPVHTRAILVNVPRFYHFHLTLRTSASILSNLCILQLHFCNL